MSDKKKTQESPLAAILSAVESVRRDLNHPGDTERMRMATASIDEAIGGIKELLNAVPQEKGKDTFTGEDPATKFTFEKHKKA
jgi:hypothetical protein